MTYRASMDTPPILYSVTYRGILYSLNEMLSDSRGTGRPGPTKFDAVKRRAMAMLSRTMRLRGLCASELPLPPGLYATVLIGIPRLSRDVDNLAAGALKVGLDTFVRQGILSNDTPKYIQGVAAYVVKRPKDRTFIAITPDRPLTPIEVREAAGF